MDIFIAAMKSDKKHFDEQFCAISRRTFWGHRLYYPIPPICTCL